MCVTAVLCALILTAFVKENYILWIVAVVAAIIADKTLMQLGMRRLAKAIEDLIK